MHKIALPSAALLALLAATACGPSVPVEDRTADISAEDAADAGEVEAEEIDDTPSEVETELGSVYEFEDGLTVELSGVQRATSGEWASPESAEYVRFTVQVQNGTPGPVDLSMMYVDCQVGEDGRRAEMVYDYEDGGLGDGFTSTVMADRNATADYGCTLDPSESYVQVEVAVQDETDDMLFRPTIFFVGDVE